MRRVAWLAGIAIAVTVGLVAFAFARSGSLPTCDGSFQGTIDSAFDAGFATREEAAAHALEVSYEVSPERLVLEASGGSLFRVTEMDGVTLESLPTVAIERFERGFVATGIFC